MKRLWSCVLLGCLVVSGTAVASPILTIYAPSSYASGTAFEITIALTGAEDLSLYNIQLVLSSPTGGEGVDYFFSDATEPLKRYIFKDLETDPPGFQSLIPDEAKHRITLSDLSILGSVTTGAEANDLVAVVTVMTTVSMVDDLTITVVSNALELDTPDKVPVGGFYELKDSLQVSIVPVPEPASAALFALGVVLLRRRSRRIVE
jgi:hypothetical protein